MKDLVGETISHYKILGRVGHGGMGVVYKAEDTHLHRPVALKFLPSDVVLSNSDRSRFAREARAAAQLGHPNIATVFDFDEARDPSTGVMRAFIAMEYVDGESLKARIARGPLTFTEIRSIAAQLAGALHTAHMHGIVHRDVKPANILLSPEGTLKLLDFGVAKLGGEVRVTEPGKIVGSVAYMAPEQLTGEDVDHRADIWALGVVLFEMLTQQLPFRGEHTPAMMYSIANEVPADVRALRPDVAEDLHRICSQCLKKDRSDRPSSMEQVLDLLGTQAAAGARASLPPQAKLLRRRLIPLAVLCAFAAILVFSFLFPSAGDSMKEWLGIASVPSQRHLAVLPFVNVGGDPLNKPFCDGLMEFVTSKLGQLEQFHGALWVVPTGEIIKNDTIAALTPSKAYSLYGATLVVTGSVQRLSDRVRLTLNLSDARNLRQLRSTTIDDRKENLAALQDVAAVKLASMLQLELNPAMRQSLRAGETSVSDAYDAYLQARGYMQRYEKLENVDAAIRLYHLAAAKDTLYALAHAGLAEAYWRKFRASKERSWLDLANQSGGRAVALGDQLAPIHVTLGLIHMSYGQHEEALVYFRRALQLDSVNADAQRGMARSLEALGRPVDAESTFYRAIALQPDYWAGYNDLGSFYSRHDRFDEAATQFGRVVSLTPDNFWGYNNLGAAFLLAGRLDDARMNYERSMELQPNYGAVSNLGTLYYGERRFRDAARMYEKSLELGVRSYDVWGNLAAAYQWIDTSKAKVAVRNAITLAERQHTTNARDAVIISDLAGYYAMLGNRPKTIELIKKAISLIPDDPQIFAQAGQVYERLGRRNEALGWIEKALTRGYALAMIERNPELDRLREDSRFRALLAHPLEKR